MESKAHVVTPTSRGPVDVPPGATDDVGGSVRPPAGSLIDSKKVLRKLVKSELRVMSAEQRAKEGTCWI